MTMDNYKHEIISRMYSTLIVAMSDLGNARDCDVDSLTSVDSVTGHCQCHRVQAQPRQRDNQEGLRYCHGKCQIFGGETS